MMVLNLAGPLLADDGNTVNNLAILLSFACLDWRGVCWSYSGRTRDLAFHVCQVHCVFANKGVFPSTGG